jgi:hypothetical protein
MVTVVGAGNSKTRQRKLREAVLAVLCRSDVIVRQALGQFTLRDWAHGYSWLDASGLALYLYDALIAQRREGTVPCKVLERLHQNLSDNKLRTSVLFEEAICLNEAFRRHGLRYLNFKGFTLAPSFCRDPSLRSQFDLDFLMPLKESVRCREVLLDLGYRVAGSSEGLLEFKKGEQRPPRVADLYKPRGERSVEVHCIHGGYNEKYGVSEASFGHPVMHPWGGYNFVSLTAVDVFRAQAVHLFRHLQSEWTRVSWLLEFRNAVEAHYHDTIFWIELRETNYAISTAVRALGVAIEFAQLIFGNFAPRQLTEWTIEALPERLRVWIQKYGMRLLLADFPGTKFFLLFQEELGLGSKHERLRKLFPMHGPPSVTLTESSSATARLSAVAAELRFAGFRLQFHAVETARYLVELRRWKRFAAGWEQRRRSGENSDPSCASCGVQASLDRRRTVSCE